MRIHNLVWAAWWFLGVIVLVGLVLRLRTGDYLLLARYTGYSMPWLLLVLLPGVLWAWLMHHGGLACLLGIAISIIFIAYVPLFWPRPERSALDTRKFKVLSYNIWSKNVAIDRTARSIQKQRADIVLLQEITPEVFVTLREVLERLYDDRKIHFSYEPKLLLAVISRYPVDFSGALLGKGRVQKVVVRSPIGPITVYNVHFLRRGGWRNRYGKSVSLLEEVLHETGAVIIGGDFNTNDQSETYRYINKFLHNAHWEAGFGFGFSYPSASIKLFGMISAPSLVRIDHIFFNDHFVPIYACTIKESGGSDHYPVMAILGLKYDQSLETVN